MPPNSSLPIHHPFGHNHTYFQINRIASLSYPQERLHQPFKRPSRIQNAGGAFEVGRCNSHVNRKVKYLEGTP
jgi:hypothetical protein